MSSILSLPQEVLAVEILAKLDLPSLAAARLASRPLAAASAPRFGVCARVARRARAARKAARTTLLLRQSLVLHAVARDQLDAVAEEEEAEAERIDAEDAAAPVVGLFGGATTAALVAEADAAARRAAASARSLRRNAAKVALCSSRAALDVARALIAGASPGLLPLPSPLPPMLPRGDACREVAALLSLSPDPVLDLCSAAHNAMQRAGEHPPLPPYPRDDMDGGSDDERHGGSEEGDSDDDDDDDDGVVAQPPGPLAPLRREMARRRALVTLQVRAEVTGVVAIAAPRLFVGPEQDEDEQHEEHEEDGGTGPILLPQPQQQAGGSGSSSGGSNSLVDAGVQTSGGRGWGPSLETVQTLKREFLALALGAEEEVEEEGAGAGAGGGGGGASSGTVRRGPARLTPESLHLILHFLRRELESWEGLPVPLS